MKNGVRGAVGPLVLVAAVAFAGVRFATTNDDAALSVGSRHPASQIAALEAAVVASSDDSRSWQRLGDAYVREASATGDPTLFSKASQALDRADELAPDDFAAIVTRGQLALILHQFAQARLLADRALAISQSNLDALAIAVDSSVELGRYDDASRFAQRMLDRRPSLTAFSRVAYLRELYGDVEGALVALRQAEIAGASAPAGDLAAVLAIRGDTLFNAGRIGDAHDSYKAALAIDAGNTVAAVGRAKTLGAMGRIDDAIAGIAPLAESQPTFGAWAVLGDLQILSGRTVEASASYDKARAEFANETANGASIDLESALFEAWHGRPDLAAAQRAYAGRPGIYGADSIAWTLHRLGRSTDARPYIDEATRLGTKDAALYYHAAAIAAATGDRTSARKHMQTAIAINPWFTLTDRGGIVELAKSVGIDSTPLEMPYGTVTQ